MSDRSNVIVVGVDGSEDSMAAVKWADHYAASTGGRLCLVTTWMWPNTYGAPLVFDGFNPDAEALTILEKAKAELTVPATAVETVCREGGAGPVLVAESKNTALLVVGSHGHGAISGVLLGSVSNYCVHHASCPVVIVR
ncbi:MAG TPA: universal stress protein [Mycobacteriales bacterium]|nr:universal stress protein [Mycobacteriales bacterium]